MTWLIESDVLLHAWLATTLQGPNRKVQNKELGVEYRVQQSTTRVRVHDWVLSETSLLLLLGLRLLGLCDRRNWYIINYNRLGGLWVIVLYRWCRLRYRGCLLI